MDEKIRDKGPGGELICPGEEKSGRRGPLFFQEKVDYAFTSDFFRYPISSSTKKQQEKWCSLTERAGGAGEDILFLVGIHAQEHEGNKDNKVPDPLRKKSSADILPSKAIAMGRGKA